METATLTQAQIKEVESIFLELREREQKKKLEEKRISLEAEALFSKTKSKYFDRIIEKFCIRLSPNRGYTNLKAAHDIWRDIIKMALELVDEKSAKYAYIHGKSEMVNMHAERICESILTN